MNYYEMKPKQMVERIKQLEKENAMLASKLRIGERGRIENLQKTVKEQSLLIEKLDCQIKDFLGMVDV